MPALSAVQTSNPLAEEAARIAASIREQQERQEELVNHAEEGNLELEEEPVDYTKEEASEDYSCRNAIDHQRWRAYDEDDLEEPQYFASTSGMEVPSQRPHPTIDDHQEAR
eukprot:TRINITY_DN7474_c0_g3_i1.p1 TRINITY_DN7474_c0_g3~~TRINITY_DN7474_c0_g3_i1.p1  ORF type:complete len:111 (+),score=29.42 TRINITY_DN7474_c0_g3_i1:374-706(+)